jgi:hypothetical protein
MTRIDGANLLKKIGMVGIHSPQSSKS